VGQLAPQPDLTRQCAFDLRSQLEILSTPPDGAGQSFNAWCTEWGSRLTFGFLPDHRRRGAQSQWAVRPTLEKQKGPREALSDKREP
jgi:hypothetical protein